MGRFRAERPQLLRSGTRRGIVRWDQERGWLRDTCRMAQDAVREVLESFRIDARS